LHYQRPDRLSKVVVPIVHKSECRTLTWQLTLMADQLKREEQALATIREILDSHWMLTDNLRVDGNNGRRTGHRFEANCVRAGEKTL
jgi:hypothetical protein